MLKKLVILIILTLVFFLLFGCNHINTGQPSMLENQKIKIENSDTVVKNISQRLNGTNIGLKSLIDIIIISNRRIDLNNDGSDDEVYIIANPYKNDRKFFSSPAFLIYSLSDLHSFKYLELDFPPIDLTQKNIKIRFGDINQDNIPEIYYSVDYPQPEHVERWPHILIYNPKENSFEDMDITTKYSYIIADWDLESKNAGEPAKLKLLLKKIAAEEGSMTKYFTLSNGELKSISN